MSRNKLFIDSLKVGDLATLGYRTHRFDSIFAGWSLDGGAPRAKFVDADGTEWDAYMFEGRMCVGSSADELKVHAIIARDQALPKVAALGDGPVKTPSEIPEVDDLVLESLDAACKAVQDKLGVAGDVAGVFFDGENSEKYADVMRRYVEQELSFITPAAR